VTTNPPPDGPETLSLKSNELVQVGPVFSLKGSELHQQVVRGAVEQTSVPAAQAEHERIKELEELRTKARNDEFEQQHQRHLRLVSFYSVIGVIAVALIASLLAVFFSTDPENRVWGRAGVTAAIASLLTYITGRSSK
jgi:phosphotransferase system  glucose/maltose/N-acetylglucosamine-specific IIC component